VNGEWAIVNLKLTKLTTDKQSEFTAKQIEIKRFWQKEQQTALRRSSLL
jgi:hypothetical protein